MSDDYLRDWEYETGVVPDGSPRYWELLRRDLAREDPRHPTPDAIRRGLASGHPVPAWVADYIAGRLSGEIRLRRGRPAWSDIGRPWGELVRKTAAAIRGEQRPHVKRILQLKEEYEAGAEEFKRQYGYSRDAYRSALEQVSEETGIPVDTLDKYRYLRRARRR